MSLNPPSKPVYLKACGMVTAVGLSVEQTAAAVRAGISGYEASSICNKYLKPMTLALLPEEVLPPLEGDIGKIKPGLTSRQQRMIRLAHLALNDLISKHDQLKNVPLMLSGPETLPEMTEACHSELIEHISKQSGIAFNSQHNALLRRGRAGGVRALQYAMAYVEAGLSDFALVGGVDTYLDLYLLATLDMQDRILAERVMDGFAPGEGAGFLLLSSKPENFQTSDKQILIYPPGLSDEPGHRFSTEPYQGDGLAQSFSLALQQAPIPPVKTIVASLNGENFGAKELGVASIRNSDRLDPEYVIEHPADCFGDVGAAFFPIAIGLTAMGFVKDSMRGPVINYASSEAQYRGAVCVAML